MQHSVTLPISNVYARGAYSASFAVGSQLQKVNLVLDSGSSTLVVDSDKYDHAHDANCSPTQLVQEIFYGMGAWFGPIVETSIQLDTHADKISADNISIAIAVKELSSTFGKADGMLGLAYADLNYAHNIASLLNLQSSNANSLNAVSWAASQTQQDLASLKKQIIPLPKESITPFFSEIEQQGLTANQFAFIVHRSSIFHPQKDVNFDLLANHPLNTGMFILGKPKRHTYLHKNDFQHAKVLHDKYYNVNVLSVQVGDAQPIAAEQLAEVDIPNYVSNGIVDTGSTYIVLPLSLFQNVMHQLGHYRPHFAQILAPFMQYTGKEQGVALNSVDLSEWPDITFTLEGISHKHVSVSLTPETYWQVQSPSANQISFKLTTLPNWPNQSILGLPLLNNHFTVFDRQENTDGAVLFASKTFCPHKLTLSEHQDPAKLAQLFDIHLTPKPS